MVSGQQGYKEVIFFNSEESVEILAVPLLSPRIPAIVFSFNQILKVMKNTF